MGDRLDVVVGRPGGQPVLVARNALLMGVGERTDDKPEKAGRSLLTELAAPLGKKKG